MPATYDKIAAHTLPSNATSYTFTGISQAYTDLVLITQSKVTSGSYQNYIRVGNGSIDSGNNYSFTILNGDGASASSLRVANYSYIGGYFDYNTSADGMISITNFQNYSNTTTYKTVLQRGSNANTGVAATVGLWRSTSAINQIQIYPTASGTFVAGSTFTLYGIKAA